MEIWATPTHPPLCTYTNSSLAPCILVQLSDLCNLGSAVHVQYGITNTCWRHTRYGGEGCAGVHRTSQIPESTKKSPNCCLRAKQVWKIGNFMYFWTKNSLKFRKGSSFVRFTPSEAKKKQTNKKTPEFLQKCPHSENQEEIHFWKICTLLRQKSLV